jgi:hypothetical protein
MHRNRYVSAILVVVALAIVLAAPRPSSPAGGRSQRLAGRLKSQPGSRRDRDGDRLGEPGHGTVCYDGR